ncbi:MAG TPA: TonB-dependent receptor [Longimicrobiales bacterium]
MSVRNTGVITFFVLSALVGAPAPRRVLAQAPAQATGEIVGTVRDSATAAPLAAARVRLLETHREELAHSDGSFRFPELAPGTYTVEVEHLGYARWRRRVDVGAGESLRLDVALPVQAIELRGMVVTGTVGPRAGEDVLSPVSVLRGAALDRELGETVAATLDGEPGIAVTSSGPATARPVIRGLGGDRILVLEDGLRPGDMSSTSGDHAVAIDPLTARHFEVVRGPMSLLYGSSALGGVVNVVREEIPASLPAHPHGTLTLQGSSVNEGLSGGGFITTALGPFALRAEASARTAGDVSTPAGTLENTGVRAYSGAVGGAWVGGRSHAGLSYRFYRNEYGIPGSGEHEHDHEEDEDTHEHGHAADIRMTRHTLRGEAAIHMDTGPFAEIKLTGAASDYQHVELEEGGATGTEFTQRLYSGELIARHGERGPFAQGAVGVRAQYRDIATGGSLRTPSTYDYTFAVFVVEELGTGPFRAQVGARYDWARYVPRDTMSFVLAGGERIPVRPRTFGSFSGSLGLLYLLSEDVRVGVSASRAYRTPDFNELYTNGPHLAANSYDVGDPGLKHETGFGLDAFLRVSGERVRGELAVFRNQLADYIFPSSRGRAELSAETGRPLFQYTNEDARFVGAEGDLEVALTPAIVLSGNASYVRARFTSPRDSIPVFSETDTTFVAASPHPPFIPPLHGRVGLRYEQPGYFAGADLRWAASQERLGDFEEPTDGYAVADISAGVRFSRGGRLHTLTVRVENVTNTEYRDHLSRIKDLMPEPGRNLGVVYRMTF